ncbi:DUF368 domain-containing protein [Kineococcus sp. TBRC 1896]|uniref:DUF368 domain-containing protein n=1 Tax=Kineococcus mangrovi TaxID=1660183 RepID=A0ABV4I5V4_9ACTN
MDAEPRPRPDQTRTSARRVPLDLVRGGLMGCAEVVPGVSGGTVALITGVYGQLIDSAGHVVSAARAGVTGGPRAAREHLRRAHWAVLVPVLAGMAVALVVASVVLEPLVTEHPVGSRAVFFGLVLASVVVPARMVGRWSPARVLTAAAMAVAAFALTGLPAGAVSDPPLVLVAAAAAVAVCALVLPGVSGSFLLLTLGLYEVTLAAVSERDLAYLGAFALGAVVGLASFVRVLQHLLERHADVTLSVMTGLLAGSLRALWPWQDGDRTLLAPGQDVGTVAALALAGAAGVALLLVVQSRLEGRLPR